MFEAAHRGSPRTVLRMRAGKNQTGFTYLVVLVAIALMSFGLVAVSEVWATSLRRERVAQLEWVGNQYAIAIRSYYEATPGVVVKTYPPTLEALLKDPRYPFVYRHLRRLYPNPMTGRGDWLVERSPDGGICAVGVDAVPQQPVLPLRFGACPSRPK
jgi:type II secretory pathway pseudopilin PulG